jgi:hypothetical protein
MTTPHIISGEIGSPREALDFCAGALDVIRASTAALDTIDGNLSGLRVGQGFLDILGDAGTALTSAEAAVQQAAEVYENHVRVQADALSDPDVRDTLLGYLDARRA